MPYYLKDGTRVPGSTTIVGLLDKSYLVEWANELGKQGIDVNSYTREKARQGTIIHGLVEAFLENTEFNLEGYLPKDTAIGIKGLEKFRKWYDTVKDNFEFIFCEKAFVSEQYKYCGIVDCYCKIGDKYTIIDFKTSKSISDEQCIQLSSYFPLLKENGLQVDQIIIVDIPKEKDSKEDYIIKVVSEKSCIIYWEIFKNLLNIYWLNKELEELNDTKGTVETSKEN